MNSSQKATYINNMPYEIFKELLSNSESIQSSYDRAEKIMMGVNREKTADNRNNANKILNNDMLLSCIRTKESLLTTKMVSLNIIFANPASNPDYFNELCEVFSTENIRTKEKIVDYAKIAQVYNTTIDNVKSNILFGKNIEKLAKQNNQKSK